MPATTSTKQKFSRRNFQRQRQGRVSRFKGLGEMMAPQLKEKTMDPRKRTLLRVVLLAEDRKDPKNPSSG